jgi:hypothetical protein
MTTDRQMREMLGYPRPPLRSENSTREGYLREVEQWKREMIEALQRDVDTLEHYNRTHPGEPPISADYDRQMIAWVRDFPASGPPPVPPHRAGKA